MEVVHQHQTRRTGPKLPKDSDAISHGGGMTWMTTNPTLNLLYWATGNPNPRPRRRGRPGDNLYTCTIVALDPTPATRWHFHPRRTTFTIGTPCKSPFFSTPNSKAPRQLLAQASRNGFYFLLTARTANHLATLRSSTKPGIRR